jgi:hypothetical protein
MKSSTFAGVSINFVAATSYVPVRASNKRPGVLAFRLEPLLKTVAEKVLGREELVVILEKYRSSA